MWRKVATALPLIASACAGSAGVYVPQAHLRGVAACTKGPTVDLSHMGPAGRDFQAQKDHFRSILLGGHCIVPDSRTIVRYVTETNWLHLKTDTERVTQLTVSIPKGRWESGSAVEYSFNELTFYFSDVGPWYATGYGWYGDKGVGTLQITRLNANTLLAKADLRVLVRHASDPLATREEHIKFDSIFTETSYDQISKCLGRSPMCR